MRLILLLPSLPPPPFFLAAPIRIYSLTTATIRSIRENSFVPSSTTAKSYLSKLLVPFRSPNHLLHLFPAYLHSRLERPSLQNPIYYLPSLIRYEIKYKKRRLQNLRKYQGALLGLLMQRGPDFGDKDSAQKVQNEVSRALYLLVAVLNQANNVNVEKDEDLPDLNELLGMYALEVI